MPNRFGKNKIGRDWTLNKICLELDSEFYVQSDYTATTWKIRDEKSVARKKAFEGEFLKHENVSSSGKKSFKTVCYSNDLLYACIHVI